MTSTFYDESYPPSLWEGESSGVTGLNPSTKAVGAAGFTLTVDGSNFTPDSVVIFDGDNRPTTFVSASRVTATIAGIVAPARTVQVAVSTGGSSPFIITAAVGGDEPTGAPAAPVVPEEAPEDPEAPEVAPEDPEAPEDPPTEAP